MKIIYKNVSQVIKSIAWSKVTKSSTTSRSVVISSCSDIKDKTKCVAKFKILSNPTEYETCNCFLGAGKNDDLQAISKFYGSPTTIDLTVGHTTILDVSFTVEAADVSANYNAKFGISGSVTVVNNALNSVIYEVEYYFQ